MNIIFDCELDQQIENLYSKGYSGIAIHEMLGVGHGTVYRHLSKMGITKTMSQAKRVYSMDEHYMDNIDTQKKAYILGLYMADGCNFTPQNDLILSINKEDRALVEKVKKEFSSDAPIHIDRNRLATLHLSSKHLSKIMESHGVVRAKSNILEFPELKPELMRHFIRGYFDGDGCLYINNKKLCYSTISFTSSSAFCLKLKEYLAKEYGFNSCITHRHKNNPNNATIQFRGLKNILPFLNDMYRDSLIHLDRKFNKYTYILNERPKYIERGD